MHRPRRLPKRGDPSAANARTLQDPAGKEPTEVGKEPAEILGGRPPVSSETKGAADDESFVSRMPVDVRSAGIWIVAAVALIWLLRNAQQVIIPFVLSGLLFYALDPAVDRLQRWRVPRLLGTMFVLATLVGALASAAYSLSDQAAAVMEELPAGVRQLRGKLNAMRGQPGTLESVQQAVRELDQTAAEAAGPATPTPQGIVKVQVEEPAFRARDYLLSGSIGVMGLAGLGLMILFLTFSLLVADDLFKRKLVKNVGPTLSKKKITVEILDEISSQIQRFLFVQLLTSLVVAVVTGAVLWGFGLRQAIVWGFLAGAFNWVPYLGPLIVTIGLAIVAFLQFGSIGMAVSVASVALAITTLEGWVLTPSLMGRVAQMNRMAVFAGLLFWTWMWGIWGTLLAVPMMMVIKVICDHVEEFQPVGDFLGE